MKFGKRLDEDLMEVGWEQHYIRYKLLKKVVKILSLAGESSFLDDVLTIFPRKSKTLESQLAKEIACNSCKRWNVFACIVNDDVKHLQGFLESTMMALHSTFETDILPNTNAMLDKCKMEDLRLEEPKLFPGSKEVETLAKFAMFQDTLTALHRFVIVNNQALTKITKKFLKRVFASVDLQTGCCSPTCARNMLMGQEGDDSGSDYGASGFTSGEEEIHEIGNPQQTFFDLNRSHGDLQEGICSIVGKVEDICPREMKIMKELETAVALLEGKVMIECSTYHDFIMDHQTQLQAQRQREKLSRVEARQMVSTRLTQHIDLENKFDPVNLLALGVVLPLVTLGITYYLSSTIYDERGDTVFDEKGYFISASIDRAPASNIGTLGLTTTLAFLLVIVFVKHKIVKKQLRGRNWMRTHRIATAFGLLSCLCGNGVAAFQHQDHATAHNTFAATFFIFGMLHVVLETILDVYLSLSMPLTRMIRCSVAILLVFSVLAFLVPMAYVLVTPDLDAATVTLWKNIAAFFEVAAFACFVIWFASYYHILRSSQFQLHVQYRVRLDSNEDLNALRVSKHHARSFSCDSQDFQMLTSMEKSDSIGLDLDKLDDDHDDIDQVNKSPTLKKME